MAPPLISTDSFYPLHHNQMPMIPNRNADYLNSYFNVTQNHSFSKHPASNIPSKYLSVGTTTSSNSETLDDQNMYDILGDQDILGMVHNTPLPFELDDISKFSQALEQGTMWDGTIQYMPSIDTAVFQSDPFDMPMQKSVKNITKAVIHQLQDREMISADQKNNKRVHMRRTQISKRHEKTTMEYR